MKINIKNTFIGSAIAFLIATSCCWIPWLAILIGGSTGAISISEGLSSLSWPFFAIGAGLLGYGSYRIHHSKDEKMEQSKDIILLSTITCPECGFQKEETMPENACQYYYECINCKTLLKPKEGDCCVFCSYGTVECPPIQAGDNCC